MWRECCADLTIWSGPLSQMVLQSTKYWHLESIADNPWSNMLTGLHSQLKSLVKSNIKDFILVLAVRFMGSYYQHLYFKTIYYDRRVRTGCPQGIGCHSRCANELWTEMNLSDSWIQNSDLSDWIQNSNLSDWIQNSDLSDWIQNSNLSHWEAGFAQSLLSRLLSSLSWFALVKPYMQFAKLTI